MLLAQRVPVMLFATVFAAHAYFYNGVAWNQSARFDPIYSFVEPGTPDMGSFRINRFVAYPNPPNTGDWALYEGKYYSNKAPGGTFLGIPVYSVIFYLEKAMGLAPRSFKVAVFNAYLLNLWLSVFWSSLGAVFLFRLLWRTVGFCQRDALFGALVYAFGTLVFPFDSQLWGHCTAAAFLILGLVCLVKDGSWSALFAGTFLGMSMLTEYLALASLPLALLFVICQRKRPVEIAFLVIGTIPPVACLLLYQKLLFGGWFTTAVALSNPILAGANFHLFSPRIFWGLVLSLNRGVLVFMPILGIAVLNALCRPLDARHRWFFLLCVSNVAAYFYAISSYSGWDGGNATGPRYLIVALPFFCLLLPPLSEIRLALRIVVAGLAAWSFFNMLVIVTVNPMVFSNIRNPLYGELYYRFFRGQFSAQEGPFYIFNALSPEQARSGVFNLGRLLHLPSAISVLPLLAFLAVAISFLVKWSEPTERSDRTRRSD
jgi:hypothetical protein